LLDQVVTPALFWRFGKPVGDKIIAEREAHKRAMDRGLVPQDPDLHLFDDLLYGADLDGEVNNGEGGTEARGGTDISPFDKQLMGEAKDNGANGHATDSNGAQETPDSPPTRLDTQ
jgi:hypothetical protein